MKIFSCQLTLQIHVEDRVFCFFGISSFQQISVSRFFQALVGFPVEEISAVFLRLTDSVIEIKCQHIDDEDEQREYEEEQRVLAQEEDTTEQEPEEDEGEEKREEEEEVEHEDKGEEEEEDVYHPPEIMRIVNNGQDSCKLNPSTCTVHQIVACTETFR